MTIGPEPMTSTRLMSVRFGIPQLLLHFVDELREQVVGVVRARRRLRMVLHRKDRLVDVAQPFDRAVVEIEVRHATFAGSESGSTAKPWFCDVISTLPLSSCLTG